MSGRCTMNASRSLPFGKLGVNGLVRRLSSTRASRCAELRRWAAHGFLATLLIFPASGWADAAVIYPQLKQPYSAIFDQVIAGVEDELGAAVAKFPLQDDTDLTRMPGVLERSRQSGATKDKVAIFLGNQSLRAEEIIDAGGVPLILGCVLEVKAYEVLKHPVLSLAPDPSVLFERLRALMPAAKRVVVVYNPEQNAWLIELAKAAAQRYGLQLDAFEARDLRSAVSFYRAFFLQADRRSDALWLPQDSTTVEERAVVPMVLGDSWEKGIVVFSSNFSHVKRGALFSFYPDNQAMGQSLGRLAKALLKSPQSVQNGMMPLRDLKGAVNLRALDRVGLTLTNDVVFATTYAK